MAEYKTKGLVNHMAQVGIVMGSDSDMPVMAKAADILEELGISYEMTIISAHREPDVFFEYAKSAEAKGFKVIIAGAGMAAHLPGMCAAIFPMPVIGIPMHTTWRKRFSVLHRTDAKRNPCGNSCNQWWCQCGSFGSKNTCHFGCGIIAETERLQSGPERKCSEERRQTAGSRI